MKPRIVLNPPLFGGEVDAPVRAEAEGTLEVLPEGAGFLRRAAHNYLPTEGDVHVPLALVRQLRLRTGMTLRGPVHPPEDGHAGPRLAVVETVDGLAADLLSGRIAFTDRTPLHPEERLVLSTDPAEVSTRVIDLLAPVGKGQRGLIVAPPRTGKTVLLRKIAEGLLANHPECYRIVLLIDERPEEVTEMRRALSGPGAEVVASTFDRPAKEHVRLADLVLAKARSLVEAGRDVVVLLDSITRLARAHNAEMPGDRKMMTGGLVAGALERPKRFFGAARALEGGGSLTVLASALVETGSRMDDVIFEEFKGTGNMELVLDRRLAEKRIYPAIEINASGTRREELLMGPEEIERVGMLRRVVADMHPVEAMERLTARLARTATNTEFLRTLLCSR
jgi:transcription termination factor Rho